MTHTYTFDNMVVIQQIGSAHIDNATAVEILRLNEQGWNCDAVHNYPQGNRCYVILSKPEIEPQEEISAQWNLAMPYMAEIGE